MSNPVCVKPGTKCNYCGAVDNFFMMGGVPFCEECGRKHGPPTADDAPSTPKSAPKVEEWVEPDITRTRTPSTADRLKSIRKSISMSPSGGAKLSMMSQASVAVQRAKRKQSITASPRPDLSASIAGGDNKEVTITKAKLLQIQKALTERVKAECAENYQNDSAILEMEIEALRQSADSLQAENTQLKTTLDEVMSTFEVAIKEHDEAKAQARANIGLLEMDLKEARQTAEDRTAQHKELFKEYTIMKATLASLQSKDNLGQSAVTELETKLADAERNFEALKVHAGEKLKAAGSQFMQVQKAHTEKTDELRKYKDSNALLKTQVSNLESANNEMKASQTALQDKLTKAQEIAKQNKQLSAALSAAQAQTNELKAQEATTGAELNEARELAAKLQKQVAGGARAEGMVGKLNEAMKALEQQNTQLKSKLYEQSSSGGSVGAPDARVGQLEGDLLQLSEALETKERENGELVMICEELMKEVEELKAK